MEETAGGVAVTGASATPRNAVLAPAEAIVDAVIAANARSVEEFRAGKEKAFNALVGQVMKASQGKANPAQAGELLRRRLG